jgi:predicted acyltransferase
MSFLNSLEQFRIRPGGVKAERLLSVDALRGFDMFWIMGGEVIFKSLDLIFSNRTTGFIVTQLDHVEWLGFRFYDIIMPLFVWLAGVSMPFSFASRLVKDPSKSALWPHIFKRFIILWILGMMVQGNLLTYDVENIRFYSNTLQAIAAGYLLASIFALYLSIRAQVIATIGLMMIFWLVMAVVPVPGFGANLYEPHLNIALYIDKLLLGKFQDGTTYTWILSSLNFGATAMLGVFAGYILKSENSKKRKFWLLAITGAGMIILGKLWHPAHPIIKHIWTGSFVLFAGGICYLMMAFFFLTVDMIPGNRWARPFIIIGSNAILAYTAWHLFDFGLISDVFTAGFEKYTGNWYPLIRAVAAFMIIFLILRFMYRKKIFVKV